jgi:hypothetical protein
LNQLITGALLAIGGAVASQATGILTVVSSGRRRKHDAAVKRAAERQAARRPLYEELLRAVHDALSNCAELSEVVSRPHARDPALRGLAEGLPERFDHLRTVAVAAMLDGSARASEIAGTIVAALREFSQAWKPAVKLPDAERREAVGSRLSDLAALLGKAERDLIAAARADLGVPD